MLMVWILFGPEPSAADHPSDAAGEEPLTSETEAAEPDDSSGGEVGTHSSRRSDEAGP
jgi:hypothetical protein